MNREVMIEDVKIIIDTDYSVESKLEWIEMHIKGIAELHGETQYLYDHFIERSKNISKLSSIYSLSWNIQTYELEINYLVKLNKLEALEVQRIVKELLIEYKEGEEVLEKVLDTLIEKYNKSERYKKFEGWER